ncbi:DNA polymerase III subunit beta [Patescibacteria group bacterium]|nr:DNA polymerase III subunit beta [Patescibacteria group bacterium]
MKLLILKESLKSGLNIVERIAGKNLSLPILENVLISTKENFLNLTTTDLETTISWWGLAKIEKKGKITSPVKFLSNLISLLLKNSVDLEVKNSTLYIKSGNFQNQIQGFDPEDFPVIPKIESAPYIKINNLQFIEGLSQVIEVISSTSTRPEISGVYFNFQKEFLKIVATDSFRLAEKTLFLEKKIDKEYSFILPQKAARELINSLLEKKGKLSIYFNSNQVMFEFPMTETDHPQLQIISKLIDGEYPNYQEIIPKKYETQFITIKKEFVNQLKAAGLFSGKINEVKLKIDPEKKGMEIFSQSAGIGQNQSFLTGKVQGKKTGISFNWRFLLDGLFNIKTKEVVFELSGEDGPAVLKPIDDPSYLYVVMPIKGT